MNNQLIINPQSLDITNKEDFDQFVVAAKLLQDQLDAAWTLVKDQMTSKGLTTLSGDWGKLVTAERINWKVTGDIDDYYLKAAPDTKKLKAAWDAGELPAGADFSTTTYITKRLKV